MAPQQSENEQSGPQVAPRLHSGSHGRKGRIVLLVAAAMVIVAAVLSVTFLVNLANTYNSTTESIESAFPEESTRPQQSSAMNILVIGTDDRGDALPEAEAAAPSDQRSDVLMLVNIPANRSHVYSISLMRDLWVTIPGHGEDKINSALTTGGVPLVVQTVESIFEQRIDHVLMINFEGFVGLTEALNGVEVYSTVAFQVGGFSYDVGPNLLSGDRALAFVRERYSFPDGDYQRVRNQQAFMNGLAAKIIAPGTLYNPVMLSNMVNEFSPYVSVDENFDAAAVGRLAMELRELRPAELVTFSLPTNGVGTSADGQSIVLPDPAAIRDITTALAQEKLGEYVAATDGS